MVVVKTCLFYAHVVKTASRNCQISATSTRVRFAPSPTGPMHIGGLRTALVNFMFARKSGGKFILRIENTDQSRCSDAALTDIFECLSWSGLKPDEGPNIGGPCGPYVQSERKDIYQHYAELLVKSGQAYPCFCSPTRLEVLKKEQRRRGETLRYDNRCRHLSKENVQRAMQQNLPFVLRFKLSPIATTLHDIVFKDIEFPCSDAEGDLVIIKSDGMPVYHFANVVDDHLMGVTHVIRGSEWITSVPKHLQLYNAFGWNPPTFAHLPLMLSSSGKKFSKRLSAPLDLSLVSNLRQAGYLPSAVLTWMSATGGLFAPSSQSNASSANTVFEQVSHYRPQWEPERFIEELLPSFELSSLTRHHARVSLPLLQQCGRLHFDRLVDKVLISSSNGSPQQPGNEENICQQVRSFLSSAPTLSLQVSICPLLKDDKRLVQTLCRLRGRVSCLSDLTGEFRFLWLRPTADSMLAVCPTLRAQRSHAENWSSFTRSALALVTALKAMAVHDNVNEDALAALLASTFDRRVLPTALTMKVLRACLTGSETGMPVVELILLLSPQEASLRLQTVLADLTSGASPPPTS
uniref:Nondiscriminating glutamyl-tRNA synthetase EARS2, mitochondrial n=1 Tax=Schistocephalus solidus TaxID=70667 RepID=A0A0X3P602_SCHSO